MIGNLKATSFTDLEATVWKMGHVHLLFGTTAILPGHHAPNAIRGTINMPHRPAEVEPREWKQTRSTLRLAQRDIMTPASRVVGFRHT